MPADTGSGLMSSVGGQDVHSSEGRHQAGLAESKSAALWQPVQLGLQLDRDEIGIYPGSVVEL